MGTKLRYEMYMPGYYTANNLSGSSGNVSWSSRHENETFGQYYGILSAKPEVDWHAEYDKEQLRQTIMKQEIIFKHQLNELHRVYKTQKDMMNELRGESHEELKHVGALHSSPFAFSSDDEKRRIGSGFPLQFNSHISSASSNDSIQSHFSSMNVKIMQLGFRSTYIGSRTKDHESLESKRKKVQRRLFDLELPAEEYVNDEVEGHQTSGGTGVGSYLADKNCEVTCEKNGNLSTCHSEYFGCNGNTLTDLNEPIVIKEVYGTASIDVRDNVCSKENIRGQDLSVNLCSGIQCSAKKNSQSPCIGNDEGLSVCNLHLEGERRQKEWVPFAFKPGQTLSNGSSLTGGFHSEYLRAPCESSQVEHKKAIEIDQNTELWTTKRIFGVEISKTKHDESTMPSQTLPQPLFLHTNVACSEPSSISSWKKLPAGLGQNLISIEGNPNAFSKSDKSSVTLVQGSGFTNNRLLVNNNLRSTSCFGPELSNGNGHSVISPLESKESQVCDASISFGYRAAITDCNSASKQVPRNNHDNIRGSGWLVNAKSPEEVNPKSYQNNGNSCSNIISVDGARKENVPQRGLSWFKATSPGNASSKWWDGSRPVNVDSLQNYSQQLVSKAETIKCDAPSFVHDSSSVTNVHDAEDKRIGGGDFSGNRRVLGVPIFENLSSEDLPSVISSSKTSGIAGANSTEIQLLNIDLNEDPVPYESDPVQKTKNIIVGKESVDCSANTRHRVDLNVGVTEEEIELTSTSMRAKENVAIEIDLETPVVVETEIDVISGDGSLENKVEEPFNLLADESKDSHEGLLKVAAEALVAISSCLQNFQDNANNHQLEASLGESLQWFADIVSSCYGDFENDARLFPMGGDGTDHKDSIPNGFDYFEYMTLNLVETTVEQYHHEPQVFETSKAESTLARRPRRGQARRGRQRKDFQRDVLPGLVSLSRNDVSEDLQLMEGLIRASGGTWNPSFSQRNSPKRKRGRGRSRAGTEMNPPETQLPKCQELVLEEATLTGWGKRTRRPPRPRCPASHPPFALQ